MINANQLKAIGATAAAFAELVTAVSDMIAECRRASAEIESHRLSQVKTVSPTTERVELICAQRDVILRFLDLHFTERRTTFSELFLRLDKAMADHDLGATKQILDTMVEIAKTSPFEQLRNAASAQVALADKSKIWEF